MPHRKAKHTKALEKDCDVLNDGDFGLPEVDEQNIRNGIPFCSRCNFFTLRGETCDVCYQCKKLVCDRCYNTTKDKVAVCNNCMPINFRF